MNANHQEKYNAVNIHPDKYIPFITAVHDSIFALKYAKGKKRMELLIFCAEDTAVVDNAVKIPSTTLKAYSSIFHFAYCQTTHGYIFQNS